MPVGTKAVGTRSWVMWGWRKLANTIKTSAVSPVCEKRFDPTCQSESYFCPSCNEIREGPPNVIGVINWHTCDKQRQKYRWSQLARIYEIRLVIVVANYSLSTYMTGFDVNDQWYVRFCAALYI